MHNISLLSKLSQLQEEKNSLILEIKNKFTSELMLKNNKQILKIKNDMSKINILQEDEKNIHVIWIGILPYGEFDYLKLWAKYNPEYKIHIWTDSNHVLINKLDKFIYNDTDKRSTPEMFSYELQAQLKDEFYNDYQIKNKHKTFDENVKQFLIDKNYAKEQDILKWKEENTYKFNEAMEQLSGYTKNEIILHDIAKESKEIFFNETYYQQYLKGLEHLHICAMASDYLRYTILYKLGGLYIDTDLMVSFNLEKVRKNERIISLVKEIIWKQEFTEWTPRPDQEFEIIVNEIVFLIEIGKLNLQNLQKFAQNLKENFETNFDDTLQILKKIATEIQNMDLNFKLNLQLSQIQIDNSLQFVSEEIVFPYFNLIGNSFLLSKKGALIWEKMINKIVKIEKQVEFWSTKEKIMSNYDYVNYNSGLYSLYYLMMSLDRYYFYLKNNKPLHYFNKVSIKNYISSWKNLKDSRHNPRFALSKESAKSVDELRKIFLAEDQNVPNYLDNPENNNIRKNISQDMSEIEKEQILKDCSLWFNEQQLTRESEPLMNKPILNIH